MTFKHVKFEDSVVMRSLERLAKEQGLVKSEPISKTASKKIAPSVNLTENVLTLCDGLRARGLNKQASELESKFLALKQAQTLYETSSEKGEDLVDAAHPKGSHKLEDVDADEAVFETILDQHLKSLKMIEKTPNGKLASSRDVLRAVKIVLGQDAKQKLLDQIREQMNLVGRLIATLDSRTSADLTIGISGILGQGYSSTIQNLSQNPTVDNIKKLQSVLGRLRFRIKPGLVSGLSQDKWDQVSPLLGQADNAAAKALELRTQYNQMVADEASKPPEEPKKDEPQGGGTGERQGVTVVLNAEGKQFMSEVNSYLAQMSGWPTAIDNDPENTDEDKANAKGWITKKQDILKKLRDGFFGIQDPNEQNNQASGYLAALRKNIGDFAQFKNTWIG